MHARVPQSISARFPRTITHRHLGSLLGENIYRLVCQLLWPLLSEPTEYTENLSQWWFWRVRIASPAGRVQTASLKVSPKEVFLKLEYFVRVPWAHL